MLLEFYVSFLLVLSIPIPQVLAAQAAPSSIDSKTCSAEDLLKKSCDFYQKNSDKEYLRTSDGKKYKNPLYSLPIQDPDRKRELENSLAVVNQPKTFAVTPRGNETEASALDAKLEHEMNIENILSHAEIKKWPLRTVKAIGNTSNLNQILKKAFPKDPAFAGLDAQPVYGPVPLDDPKAKVMQLNDTQINQITESIGKDNLNKLKESFSDLDRRMKSLGRNDAVSVNGGSANPNAVVEEPASTFQKSLVNGKDHTEFTEKNKRISKLVKYAKDQIIDLIKNGKPDTQLSIEQRNLIKKIETIEFLPPEDIKVAFMAGCESDDGAFYHPSFHTLTVCKGFYDLSDSQMVGVLAHELGHSIDPCMTNNILYKVDQDKLDALTRDFQEQQENDFEKAGSGTGETTQDPARAALKEELNFLNRSGTTYLNSVDTHRTNGPANKILIEKGVLTKVADPVPTAKHPFETVRSCLVNEEGIDEVSNRDIEAEVAIFESLNKRNDVKNSKEASQKLKADLQAGKHCEGSALKRAETQESMSDFYGAFTQARYLSEHPAKDITDAIGTVSIFSGRACGTKEEYGDIKNPIEILSKPHPRSSRRLKAVYFKMPGIAENFGCELKPKSKCFANQEFLLKRGSTNSDTKGSQK